MQAINGFFDGRTFIPLETIEVKKNQKVIITVLEEYLDKNNQENTPMKEFFGVFDDETYFEFQEALKECEEVDINEW